MGNFRGFLGICGYPVGIEWVWNTRSTPADNEWQYTARALRAHLHTDPVREAVEYVSAAIAAAMGSPPP